MKLSYSQAQTYINCSKMWEFKYVKKLDSPEERASLFFGTAIDNAIMGLLEGETNPLTIFSERWETQKDFKGNIRQIFNNDNIVYSYTDFDKDVFKPEDLDSLKMFITDLELEDKEPFELYSDCVRKKKAGTITDKEQSYFNKVSWLSLLRKGELLVKAFQTQFYPEIERVVRTQHKIELKSQSSSDSISGVEDFMCYMKGQDEPIIFDLKTSANMYDSSKVDLTEQLVVYAASELLQKSEEQQAKGQLVGYVVLVKNLQKDDTSVCKSCGHKKDGNHKTCNNVINGKRCGGEWDVKREVKPIVQVITRRIMMDDINNVLEDYVNVIEGIKNKIVVRNRNLCSNFYGAQCPFYEACHKNDYSNLKEK